MFSEAALSARHREPIVTAERKLEAHVHGVHGRESQRRAFIDKKYGINRQLHALAAVASMCTPPFLLHKMIAFDLRRVSLSVRSPRGMSSGFGGGPFMTSSCKCVEHCSAAHPLELLLLLFYL